MSWIRGPAVDIVGEDQILLLLLFELETVPQWLIETEVLSCCCCCFCCVVDVVCCFYLFVVDQVYDEIRLCNDIS